MYMQSRHVKGLALLVTLSMLSTFLLDRYNMWRIIESTLITLQGGNVYELTSHGYGLSHLMFWRYPPLMLYVGAAIARLGLPFVLSLKLLFILCLVLGTYLLYLSIRGTFWDLLDVYLCGMVLMNMLFTWIDNIVILLIGLTYLILLGCGLSEMKKITWSRALIGGVLTGLAFSTKQVAAVLALPLLPVLWRRGWKIFIMYLIGALISFSLCSLPYILSSPASYLSTVFYLGMFEGLAYRCSIAISSLVLAIMSVVVLVFMFYLSRRCVGYVATFLTSVHVCLIACSIAVTVGLILNLQPFIVRSLLYLSYIYYLCSSSSRVRRIDMSISVVSVACAFSICGFYPSAAYGIGLFYYLVPLYSLSNPLLRSFMKLSIIGWIGPMFQTVLVLLSCLSLLGTVIDLAFYVRYLVK